MRIIFLVSLISICISNIQAQHSIELTTGITFSKLQLEENMVFSETDSGNSVFVNFGYQYEFGEKRRLALVSSFEFLKRNSKLTFSPNLGVFGESSVRFTQLGFSPKIRYFFIRIENNFRPFLSVGPTFRYNFEATDNGFDIDEDAYNTVIFGGVYNLGFDWSIDNKIGVLFETGVMNDFQNNFTNFYSVDGKSKFFDYYARVGINYHF
ncbi:hypothetical protein GCM10009430_19940 [Aquimarina litoralis]|uniref:Outer membrane protein beta-barrel domain-containing protein n=1 Tax=Aquimarina litoralis TaxID=584605 RepID=A0ABP3TXJ7_9FLAO